MTALQENPKSKIQNLKSDMHAATQAWLIGYLRRQSPRQVSPRRLRGGMIIRWTLWEDGNLTNAIPGYEACPADDGTGAPAGWTLRDFRALCAAAMGKQKFES
jgi:hypothetical protein